GYISDKTKSRIRLRRLEGQIRGIDRMVDEDRYCIDILTQISAVTRALENVALGLLDDHLKHCVLDAALAGRPVSEQRLGEASEAIARL
uniref:metal-sensitive transcriptional regulator n=1 Tax=Micrococcus sp. GbtcB5 TaxID=2824750 RepID=UPI0020C5E107